MLAILNKVIDLYLLKNFPKVTLLRNDRISNSLFSSDLIQSSLLYLHVGEDGRDCVSKMEGQMY